MYRLVACDTDSIKFCNEDGSSMSEQDMDSILKLMNDATPSGVNLEKDGYYPKFLVIKSKNYVTFDGNKLKYRGSSILDAKKEPALLEMMKTLIDEILNDNDISVLISIYNKYTKEALNPTDIKRWLAKKTITNPVLNPERTNEQKVYDSCQHAIKEQVIAGIQAGDKIWVYQAIDGMIQAKAKGELVFSKKGEPKMIENTILKFGELYNNDQDRLHYVERVYKTLSILSNVIDIEKFPKYYLKKNQPLLESL